MLVLGLGLALRTINNGLGLGLIGQVLGLGLGLDSDHGLSHRGFDFACTCFSRILIQMYCHWVDFMNLSSLRCWEHSSSVFCVCQRHLLQSSAFFPEWTYYVSKPFAHVWLYAGNVDVFEMYQTVKHERNSWQRLTDVNVYNVFSYLYHFCIRFLT